MGVRVAYGNRDAISPAIQTGKIPADSLIISKEHDDLAELFFYDVDGNFKPISERTRFLSLTEATAWAKKYNCAGRVYSVQNGSEWQLYLVQNDFSLTPVLGSDIEVNIDDIECIDGGGAADRN